MADLTDDIEAQAAEPKRVRADGQEAESHSLADLIAADRYLKQAAGTAKPHQGLRFTKLVPPGSA